jgi:hypothetical protein
MKRPSRDEYADYYHLYVGRIPDGDILERLEAQCGEMESLAAAMSPEKVDYRYEEGKWSIKEVLGHVNDVDRLFSYRMLAFARGDATPIPGMEQDDWVAQANFGARTVADLVEEFVVVRRGFILLCRSLDDEAWMRRGTASGVAFTARAIPWILAGHVQHHFEVIRDRYLD